MLTRPMALASIKRLASSTAGLRSNGSAMNTLARSSGRVLNAHRVGDRGRHRLLAEHVFTRFQTEYGEVGVTRMRRRNDDRIDLRSAEEIFEARKLFRRSG